MCKTLKTAKINHGLKKSRNPVAIMEVTHGLKSLVSPDSPGDIVREYKGYLNSK